jgi:hypothetical protein
MQGHTDCLPRLRLFFRQLGNVSNHVGTKLFQVRSPNNRGAETYTMAGEPKSLVAMLHRFTRDEVDAVLTEPLPQEWRDLLRRISEREADHASRDQSPDEIHHKLKYEE